MEGGYILNIICLFVKLNLIHYVIRLGDAFTRTDTYVQRKIIGRITKS